MHKFTIIVGYRASDRAIGANGQLPWRIPKDMNFFRKITTGMGGVKNAVIMGRTTFESMNSRPLAGRINFVCTSREDVIDLPEEGLFFVRNLDEALLRCDALSHTINKVFVIGGARLYETAIMHPACEELIVNEFSPCARAPSFDINTIPCDAFFPPIDEYEYDLILDYNSVDSISEIRPTTILDLDADADADMSAELFVKIRYKKYVRKSGSEM